MSIQVFTSSTSTYSTMDPTSEIDSQLKQAIDNLFAKYRRSNVIPKIISHNVCTTVTPESSIRSGQMFITVTIIYED